MYPSIRMSAPGCVEDTNSARPLTPSAIAVTLRSVPVASVGPNSPAATPKLACELTQIESRIRPVTTTRIIAGRVDMDALGEAVFDGETGARASLVSWSIVTSVRLEFGAAKRIRTATVAVDVSRGLGGARLRDDIHRVTDLELVAPQRVGALGSRITVSPQGHGLDRVLDLARIPRKRTATVRRRPAPRTGSPQRPPSRTARARAARPP